jgi:ketosteroid isomerase-like protein
MLDHAAAVALVEAWTAAWNAHDLEAILAHYTDDVVFVSPFVVKLLGEPSGTLRGKEALRAYFARALAAYPDLRFEPRAMLVGVGSLVYAYQSVGGLQAAEVMFVAADGRVDRVLAHYDRAP